MPLDIVQWAEGLDLGEHKETVLKAPGAEKNLAELEKRGLRQSEFSKAMNEATAAKQKAEEEARKANEYYQTVNKWRMEKETEFNTAVEARLGSVRAQLAASGLSDEELDAAFGGQKVNLRRGEPAGTGNAGNGNGNDPKYVTPEQIKALERQYAALPALYMTLGAEHAELFGSSRVDWEPLVKQSLESGKSLRAVWEEKYNVQAKRDEIAKAAHDKEMKEAEERGAKAALDKLYQENPDMLSRVHNPSMPQSVIHDIAKRNAAENQNIGGEAARLARVAKAVEAWPKVQAEAAGTTTK